MNISSNAQDYFYYLDGKKVPFSLSNSTMCLKIDPSSNVQSIISSLEECRISYSKKQIGH